MQSGEDLCRNGNAVRWPAVDAAISPLRRRKLRDSFGREITEGCGGKVRRFRSRMTAFRSGVIQLQPPLLFQHKSLHHSSSTTLKTLAEGGKLYPMPDDFNAIPCSPVRFPELTPAGCGPCRPIRALHGLCDAGVRLRRRATAAPIRLVLGCGPGRHLRGHCAHRLRHVRFACENLRLGQRRVVRLLLRPPLASSISPA